MEGVIRREGIEKSTVEGIGKLIVGTKGLTGKDLRKVYEEYVSMVVSGKAEEVSGEQYEKAIKMVRGYIDSCERVTISYWSNEGRGRYEPLGLIDDSKVDKRKWRLNYKVNGEEEISLSWEMYDFMKNYLDEGIKEKVENYVVINNLLNGIVTKENEEEHIRIESEFQRYYQERFSSYEVLFMYGLLGLNVEGGKLILNRGTKEQVLN